jgi:hypothetical protein
MSQDEVVLRFMSRSSRLKFTEPGDAFASHGPTPNSWADLSGNW